MVSLSLVAIVVSILAMLISLGNLAWNVYSKFLHPKPTLKTSVKVMQLVDGDGAGGRIVSINTVNHGPTAAIIQNAVCRLEPKGANKGKWDFGLLLPLPDVNRPDWVNGPFGGDILPKRIDVGESLSLYFSYEEQCFLTRDVTRAGVTDSWGRYHWASVKELHAAQVSHRQAHPEQWEPGARPW